jgi:hypothetical protein
MLKVSEAVVKKKYFAKLLFDPKLESEKVLMINSLMS